VIRLTRLNGSEMYLNADLIATVESHHDTVLTLVDGKTYVVSNTADEVVDAITAYRATVIATAERLMDADVDADENEEQPPGRLLVLRPGGNGSC
jgi:flagellar protein FlbD